MANWWPQPQRQGARYDGADADPLARAANFVTALQIASRSNPASWRPVAIAATKTTAGLNIAAAVDVNHYPKGHKVPALELAKLNIKYDAFHPDWNYTIYPRQARNESSQ